MRQTDNTYEINPDDISGLNLMGFPNASNGGEMLKAHSTEQTMANNE